jgi:hypothetical protein
MKLSKYLDIYIYIMAKYLNIFRYTKGKYLDKSLIYKP